MQDYLNHLEKLRKDAAECRLISDLATDTAKRELFDRLASHLIVLADQVSKKCSSGSRERLTKAVSHGARIQTSRYPSSGCPASLG